MGSALAGGLCIWGGFYLLSIETEGFAKPGNPFNTNILEAIAHGVGWYCLGKGFSIWATTGLSSAKMMK